MAKVRCWLLAGAVAWGAPTGLQAQVRASEPATVSQTVDGTVLTVEYSRPRTRGRSPIYGKEVKWGEVWTPGANWATTLDVSNDVTIDGHAVPKGKYSVWMEVEQGAWTVILDPKAKQFHTAHPKPDSSQIRFPVTPDSVAGPEVLLWSFPELSSTGTVLEMAWAGRSARLTIAVTPSHPLTLDANLAPRYVGDYAVRWIPRDTAAAPDSTPPPQETWKVSYNGGKLMLDWEVTGDSGAPYHAILVSIGDDAFYPGFVEEGDMFDAVPSLATEFAVVDGKATGFVIRRKDDSIQAVGTRVP
jgi:hypothetical protein